MAHEEEEAAPKARLPCRAFRPGGMLRDGRGGDDGTALWKEVGIGLVNVASLCWAESVGKAASKLKRPTNVIFLLLCPTSVVLLDVKARRIKRPAATCPLVFALPSGCGSDLVPSGARIQGASPLGAGSG